MSQWFRGRMEGHYVGMPASRVGVSQFGTATKFQMRIYRALIRDIEVLAHEAEAPDEVAEPAKAPIELPDACFHQAKIEQTRLLGLRLGTCFEGTVYDVAVSQIHVTHRTLHNGKTYGRVVGDVYGRYILPPRTNAEEAAKVVEDLTTPEEALVDHEERAHGDESAEESPMVEVGSAAFRDATSRDATSREEPRDPSAEDRETAQALHAVEATETQAAKDPSHAPLIVFAVIVAIALGLAGGWVPMLVWVGMFIPVLVMRVLLEGVVRAGTSQRLFGAMVIVLQAACLARVAYLWWQGGCETVDPWMVAGVSLTTLVSSVLPIALPLMCTGTGLGVMLLLWFAPMGIACEPGKHDKSATEQPSVRNPGVPRTNSDGSWPRRAPTE